MPIQRVLSVIEDEGEVKVFLLGTTFAAYKQVDISTLPQSVLERIALLKLTPVNKLAVEGFGRRLSDWHTSVYLTQKEYSEIDNTRKESKGQGSKATEEV